MSVLVELNLVSASACCKVFIDGKPRSSPPGFARPRLLSCANSIILCVEGATSPTKTLHANATAPV